MRITDRARPWIEKLAMYEPGRPIEEVARDRGLDPDDIVKVASNENALGPSPAAIEAMRREAANMHRYPDGGGFYLRRALAEHYDLPPECFVLGSGSNELIVFLSHVFLEPGDRIVTADRAFVVYRLAAGMYRAETVAVPMREYTHDLDAMRAAVDERTKLVYISNPNNPTGTAVDADAIDAFMRDVPEHVVVVFDEAYDELMPPDERSQCMRYIEEDGRAVVLRTFSKAYGLAGLRIGYAAAPAPVARLLHRVRQPFNVNAMAQAAAIAALEDTDHVERTQTMVRDGLRYFEEEFGARGLDYIPSKVNFICVKVGRGREVFQALQQRGVIVRPMDGYRLPDYVRISVGTRRENERVMRELSALQQEGLLS